MEKRISDIITKNEINSWKKGDLITISAGTGTGKSYFIKNDLFEYAKKQGTKILFLLHRKNAITQFKQELKKENKNSVIKIKSYQSIKQGCLNGEPFDFSPYGYIVSDEFHYYLNDAGMDRFIDLSFQEILKQENCIKIFMSATGYNMMYYLNEISNVDVKPYEIPQDYSYIKQLLFYSKIESLKTILKKHEQEGKKAIVFTTAERAYELHKEYKECSIFNCSESNKYYRYVDKKKIEIFFENERFDELFLFTTTTMDTGVNINDVDLHTIICDLSSESDIQQAVGRKRLVNTDDYVNVYIKTRSKDEIQRNHDAIKDLVDKYTCLVKEGEEQFLAKYPRDVEMSGIYYIDFDKEKNKVYLHPNQLIGGSFHLKQREYKIQLKYGYKHCIAVLFEKVSMEEG